jgi:hypothetical protein
MGRGIEKSSRKDNIVIREKDVKVNLSFVKSLKKREENVLKFNLFQDAIFEGYNTPQKLGA